MSAASQPTQFDSLQALTSLLAAHLVPRLRLRDCVALLGSCSWMRQLVTQGAGVQAPSAAVQPSRADLTPGAEQAWADAAASAGLQDPPALFSQSSLAGMGGCSGTLRQHACSCANALAGRVTLCQDLVDPPAVALRSADLACMATAENPSDETHNVLHVCISQPGCAEPRRVPVPGTSQVCPCMLLQFAVCSVSACIQLQRACADGDWPLMHLRSLHMLHLQVWVLALSQSGRHLALACSYADRSSAPGKHDPAAEGLLGEDRGELLVVWLLELHTEQLTNAGVARAPLQLDWAPGQDLLAYQGQGKVAVVNAFGNDLAQATAPSREPSHLAWRPDSLGFILCDVAGAMFCMAARGGQPAEVGTQRWEYRDAAFLPCSWLGQFWVAVAICRPRHPRRLCISLHPCNELGGSHGVTKLPLRECCHLAASAHHVVVICCEPPGEIAGPGSVHLYAIKSERQNLVLQPQHIFQPHTERCTCALSPCGLMLAYTAMTEPPAGKHWSVPERNRTGSLLSIVCLQSPAFRSDTAAQPRFGDYSLSIRWSLDSCRVVVTGSAIVADELGFFVYNPCSWRDGLRTYMLS